MVIYEKLKYDDFVLEGGKSIPGVPTPMVSPREISSHPIFISSLATYATLAGCISPSIGHPTTHDMYLVKWMY